MSYFNNRQHMTSISTNYFCYIFYLVFWWVPHPYHMNNFQPLIYAIFLLLWVRMLFKNVWLYHTYTVIKLMKDTVAQFLQFHGKELCKCIYFCMWFIFMIFAKKYIIPNLWGKPACQFASGLIGYTRFVRQLDWLILWINPERP